MKNIMLAAAALVLFAVPSHAQSTMPITVPSTDVGLATYMHPNYYSIPVTIGSAIGTMWLYPQPCNSSGVCGFVSFRPPVQGNGGYALVTAWFANTYNSIGQVTSATLNYTVTADPDGDGDSDTVMGSITFSFSYYYKTCGRYCTGYHEIISGTGQQSITAN